MKRMVFTTMAILSVGVIMLGTPKTASAQRQRVCSNSTLRGDYAVHATGSAPSGQFAGPIAFVGLFSYDGRGGLVGKLTIRLNDVMNGPTTLTANYQGTYVVNANCTF